MNPEVKPPYQTPKVLVLKDIYNEPSSEFHGMPHYKVFCGSSQASLIGVENVLAHFGMLMQECDRLRWIISEVDRRAGGTLVFEVSEETQSDWEVLQIGQDGYAKEE